MALVPNVETLSLIAGVGGWSGVYHGLSIYLDDTPTTPAKVIKITLLPLFWGSCGITSFLVLWLSFQGSVFVVSNMLRPIPFTLHMLTLCGIFCAYAARKQIRQFLFVTPAEAAVAEQAQDRAEADATEADQADATEVNQDESESEEEQADATEADQGESESEEEQDDGEEEQDDGEEHVDEEEESNIDDATTITDEDHTAVTEDNSLQHADEEESTLIVEVDRLMMSAGPTIGTETEIPEADIDEGPVPAPAPATAEV